VEFAPLAVCVGLNDPQAPTGVQLQSTPALALSFETVAATGAVAATAMALGGAVVRLTATAGVGAGEPLLDELEVGVPTAPQPKRFMSVTKNTTKNVAQSALRVCFTVFSLLQPRHVYHSVLLRHRSGKMPRVPEGQAGTHRPPCYEDGSGAIRDYPERAGVKRVCEYLAGIKRVKALAKPAVQPMYGSLAVEISR
jgi:hypothetical protein